jgi:hypothetical protein
MSLMEDVVAGMVGGLAGGLVMTAAMTMGSKAGIIDETLPHKFEQKMEDGAGFAVRTGPDQEQRLAQAEHLLFSAALGAGYGALHGTLGLRPVPGGPLFGLAVYTAVLGNVGPALGITEVPWHEPKATVGRQVMMHIIFGTMTAAVAEQVRPHLP